MDAKTLWEKLIKKARVSEFETHTVPQNNNTPLWFQVGVQGSYLVISKARSKTPSVNLSRDRKINFKDFELVHSYYERWKNGETGIRYEVSRKSRNTAYIFALIDHASKTFV
ncbi:hypothetical protein [Neobacillus sp. SAB-20_R2A]|uniref:hypothetical protein n=1 Tax=Neobacillus sp. SAB-20_R2A TaxID=3120519 RepID=UPI003C6E0761